MSDTEREIRKHVKNFLNKKLIVTSSDIFVFVESNHPYSQVAEKFILEALNDENCFIYDNGVYTKKKTKAKFWSEE